MAVKSSQRLQLVLQLAEKAEQAAAADLQANAEQLLESEQQLLQVSGFHKEYVEKLNAKLAPSHASEMINDRAFLQQVGEACQAQENRYREIQQRKQALLNHWQSLHYKRKNIEKMIARLRRSEGQLADKQLQKELDELSSLSSKRPPIM